MPHAQQNRRHRPVARGARRGLPRRGARRRPARRAVPLEPARPRRQGVVRGAGEQGPRREGLLPGLLAPAAPARRPLLSRDAPRRQGHRVLPRPDEGARAPRLPRLRFRPARVREVALDLQYRPPGGARFHGGREGGDSLHDGAAPRQARHAHHHGALAGGGDRVRDRGDGRAGCEHHRHLRGQLPSRGSTARSTSRDYRQDQRATGLDIPWSGTGWRAPAGALPAPPAPGPQEGADRARPRIRRRSSTTTGGSTTS